VHAAFYGSQGSDARESDDTRHGQPETPSATAASDWQLGRSSLG
jgi:hypothetical protein